MPALMITCREDIPIGSIWDPVATLHRSWKPRKVIRYMQDFKGKSSPFLMCTTVSGARPTAQAFHWHFLSKYFTMRPLANEAAEDS